jgi:DNA repair protein RadA/Sms
VPPGCGPAATGAAPPGMDVLEVGDVRTAAHYAARASSDA